MMIDRYQQTAFDLLYKVRSTQRETIIKAGELVAQAVEKGNRVYLGNICHQMEYDLYDRGGGPVFYQLYDKEKTQLHPGDVLFISSVSGRSLDVVNLAYDSIQAGVNVISFTSMEYAQAVEPVHFTGKKLYEFSTLTLDNCAPAAEAMMEVDGIEARFAAASGIASDFIMWSLTAVAIEKLLTDGFIPGILKSNNYPGGIEYNDSIRRHYEEFGW